MQVVAHVALVAALVAWRLLVGQVRARPQPPPELLLLERVLGPFAALRRLQVPPVLHVAPLVAPRRPVARLTRVAPPRADRELLRLLLLVTTDVLLHHLLHLLARAIGDTARLSLRVLVHRLHRLLPLAVVSKLQQNAVPRLLRLLVPLIAAGVLVAQVARQPLVLPRPRLLPHVRLEPVFGPLVPALVSTSAPHPQAVGPHVALVAAELRLPLLLVPLVPPSPRRPLDEVGERLDAVQLARLPPHLVRLPFVLVVPRLVPLVLHPLRPPLREPRARLPLVVHRPVLLVELGLHVQLIQRPLLALQVRVPIVVHTAILLAMTKKEPRQRDADRVPLGVLPLVVLARLPVVLPPVRQPLFTLRLPPQGWWLDVPNLRHDQLLHLVALRVLLLVVHPLVAVRRDVRELRPLFVVLAAPLAAIVLAVAVLHPFLYLLLVEL